MEIIRNCLHYGSTQIAVDLDENAVPTGVVKTAFNEAGAGSLKREFEGISWYDRNTSSIISFKTYNNTFSQLKLAYKKGCVGNLKLPLARNCKKIHNALSYYIDIFRKDSSSFSHGDYSIDNILFSEDEVVWILDWEDFNEKLPREFDVIYCVMEACYFCYKRQNALTAQDVDMAVDLIKYAIERLNMPSLQIVKRPAAYIRELFLNNNSVFGPQIIKYPLMNCPHEDILALDAAFYKRTGR
jgi:hypothetical protein